MSLSPSWKAKLAVLVLLLASATCLPAQGVQSVKGTYGSGPPQSTNCPGDVGTQFIDTTANQLYVITAISQGVNSTTCTWTQAGGTSSPSSLTTFFNRFFGLSPQDYGAFGDWHIFADCGMATNNHVTCAAGHFVAGDVGKTFEITTALNGSGVPTAVVTGTITAFNSATDVTVSQTAGSTFTNQRFGFGHNDNAAVQAWAAALTAASTNGTPTLVRSGYIPQGGYYITQPVNLTSPCGTNSGTTTCGEGGSNAVGNGTLAPSLWILGSGDSSSYFEVATAGNFNWGSGSANTAAVYIKGWSFSQVAGFSVIFDGTQHNTTADTGLVGGVMFDNGSHNAASQLWIQHGANTTHTLVGLIVASTDFESSYSNIAIESNDQNMCAGCGLTANATFEKELFDTIFLENPGVQGGQSINLELGNLTSGTVTFSQVRFRNINSWNATLIDVHILATVAAGNPTVATSQGDSLVFDELKASQQNGAGSITDLGFVVEGGFNGRIECISCVLSNPANNAGTSLVDWLPTSGNASLHFLGGALSTGGLTSVYVNMNSAAGFVYLTDTTFYSGGSLTTSPHNIGSSVTKLSWITPNGQGWAGPGGWQASTFSTFSNCAVNSVSPAACGSAAAGAFVVPTTTTTYTVNTTAVTAASRIILTPMSFAGNLPSTPTCVAPAVTSAVTISAISAGTSFTFALPSTTGQTCWQYIIEN